MVPVPLEDLGILALNESGYVCVCFPLVVWFAGSDVGGYLPHLVSKGTGVQIPKSSIQATNKGFLSVCDC